MKRILFIITSLWVTGLLSLAAQITSVQSAPAQPGTSVSVHVDGERLENLLTAEQKKTVRDLRITGRLHADDYAYLRNILLEQLDTLNLRDADIDTIPVRAFYDDGFIGRGITVCLPVKLEHLADSAFCGLALEYTLILSSKYPTLGFNVYNHGWEMIDVIKVELSDDNAYCKKVGDCIYSKDGTIAYYYNADYRYTDPVTFMEGTKVICGHAFENRFGDFSIIIPETLDSIGDRAFVNRGWSVPTRNDWPLDMGCCIFCYAKVPPKLGQDVFSNIHSNQEISLFVPDESEEAYRAADGWKEFDINPELNPKQEINAPFRKNVTIENNGMHYVVSSIDKKIEKISIYDVSGRLAYTNNVNDVSVHVSKLTLSSPYSMIRINYSDGTKETIKIKP